MLSDAEKKTLRELVADIRVRRCETVLSAWIDKLLDAHDALTVRVKRLYEACEERTKAILEVEKAMDYDICKGEGRAVVIRRMVARNKLLENLAIAAKHLRPSHLTLEMELILAELDAAKEAG